MTKKKKGTLKDMVKAPRTIDIEGQLHMLAWITPQEGKVLKELGGAGKKGPMGIPAYVAGNIGGFSSQAGDSDANVGTPGEQGGGHGGGGLSSVGSGSNNNAPTGVNVGRGEDSPDAVNENAAQFVGKYGINISPNQVHNIYTDSSGRLMAVQHDATGLMANIAQALGFGTPSVVTGRTGYGPGSQTGIGDGRGGPDQTITPAVSVAPVEEEEEDTPLTQAMKDYYTMGVGTGTKPLEMTDIIQASESPIGSRYDREKGLLYLADGTIIDIKTGKKVNQKSRIKPLRISGLEMFKPIGG